jgi:hypothetical protein
VALISFDIKQTTPADAKAAVGPLLDFAEKCCVTTGNWDKALIFDNLKKAAEAGIDAFYKPAPLVVGAPPVSAAVYLGGFTGVTPANAAFVTAHPEVIVKLMAKRRGGSDWFSHDEQAAMLAGAGGIDWMQLLMTLAPILIKILLGLFL